MRRKMRQPILFYVVLGLLAIGVLSAVFRDPKSAIIPVAVFGIVFLLYKFPPSRWKAWLRGAQNRASGKRRETGPLGGIKRGVKPGPYAKARNVQRAKFRVIPGSKTDRDEPPKYH